MKIVLVSSLITATLAFASVSEANARTLERNVSVTGPNGHTVSKSASITRTGPHRVRYTKTVTGPHGNSVTTSGRVVAHPHHVHGYHVVY